MFAPGTRYDYVNTNTVLLGLVVQKVSHQPVAVYIKTHILEPLRLTHTSLPAGAAFPSPHAQGYTKRSPECVLADRKCNRLVNATSWNASWGWAAGAMVSTLGDLRVWARDVATGKLLSRATQKQRLRFLATGTRSFGYGLGLMNLAGVDRSQRIAPWLPEPDDLPALRTSHDRGAHQHRATHSPPAGVPAGTRDHQDHHAEARNHYGVVDTSAPTLCARQQCPRAVAPFLGPDCRADRGAAVPRSPSRPTSAHCWVSDA